MLSSVAPFSYQVYPRDFPFAFIGNYVFILSKTILIIVFKLVKHYILSFFYLDNVFELLLLIVELFHFLIVLLSDHTLLGFFF